MRVCDVLAVPSQKIVHFLNCGDGDVQGIASCPFGDDMPSDEFLCQFFDQFINIQKRNLFEQRKSLLGHAPIAIGRFFKNDL